MDDIMKPVAELWENSLSSIKKALDEREYYTWIEDHLAFKRYDRAAGVLYLRVDTDFHKSQLAFKYAGVIENAASEAFGAPLRIRFLLPGEAPPEKKADEVEDLGKIFNPRYTFDNFIVGDNSRFAAAGAQAVAAAPGKAHSPLFIYGDSGLGKTHLMHAIGIHILQHFPKLKVLYVSSETFTEDFVNSSIHKKMNIFKEKYRGVDVLLIDDIQFISEKEKTIEEVFHTYEALYNSRKQMVFTSDRQPKDILGLDERLKGRLAQGLLVDIQPPSYEIKIAILKNLAKLDGVPEDDGLSDVISFIAEIVKTNVRELEAAFNRVVFYTTHKREPFTRGFARDILKDMVPLGGDPSPKDIKKVVAGYFNIPVPALDSEERTRSLSTPRQTAMYLCYEMTELSFPKIAEAFKKDYSTVNYAYKKIKGDIETNDHLKNIVVEIREKIQDSF